MFAKAREKARQITCTSNEKQLGLGLMQYVQDYDDTFPGGDKGFYAQEGRGWAARIYSYVKSTNVYKCPDDPTPAQGNLVPISYGINSNLCGPFAAPLTLASLSAPASTVEFFETEGAVDYVNDPAGDMQTPLTANSSVAGDGGDDGGIGFIDAVSNAKYATGAMG